VQEYCRESTLDEAYLLELGWYTKEVIVSYMECKRCRQKGYQVEENRGQGVISDRQKWCGCQKKKAQQSSTWAGVPEGAAKEEGRQREVR